MNDKEYMKKLVEHLNTCYDQLTSPFYHLDPDILTKEFHFIVGKRINSECPECKSKNLAIKSVGARYVLVCDDCGRYIKPANADELYRYGDPVKLKGITPKNKIKVKYFADITPIEKFTNGDWVDLRTSVDISMKKGETAMIPLGIAMEIPEGYEAIVASRSSTPRKLGIMMLNGIGIIDESYNGDGDQWYYPAIAIRDVFIPADTRIAQFRLFRHQPDFEFETVDRLGNEDRGGFGSTGYN